MMVFKITLENGNKFFSIFPRNSVWACMGRQVVYHDIFVVTPLKICKISYPSRLLIRIGNWFWNHFM